MWARHSFGQFSSAESVRAIFKRPRHARGHLLRLFCLDCRAYEEGNLRRRASRDQKSTIAVRSRLHEGTDQRARCKERGYGAETRKDEKNRGVCGEAVWLLWRLLKERGGRKAAGAEGPVTSIGYIMHFYGAAVSQNLRLRVHK